MSQWKPMSEAPRNKTILCLCEDGVLTVGFWGKHDHVPIYGWLRQRSLNEFEVDGITPIWWAEIPELPDKPF